MAKEVPGGYSGKILRVNLSNGSTTTEELDPLFCRRYIGGAGFVTYYLWKELPPGVGALGPDNKLVFALGPVSGLQLPGAARHCTGAKSPLTGGIAKCEAGGYWAAEFKRTGYDALIVEGKADKPVYLFTQDGEASIKDAGHLWGKETKETQEAIRAELGDSKVELCQIGPGGENMVRFACIMSGLKDAAGRGGLGAVMGSKNLKAVAVRGHRLPKIADRERLKEIRQQMVARKHFLSEYGTGGVDMEQMVVGERILTTARLFNIKQGITSNDDILPERYYQPKTDGPLSDKPLNREKMEKAKSYYYTLMGWDANGVPLPEKVEELYIE